MSSIECSLQQFIQALLQGQPVVVDGSGKWTVEGAFKSCLRQFFGCESARVEALAHAFSAILDSLESEPVRFSSALSGVSQTKNFKNYLRAADAILAQLKVHTNPSAIAAYKSLKMRTVALKYRLEAVNGGVNPQAPSQELQATLMDCAEAWKASLDLVQEKKLNKEQRLAIESISRFPEYVDVLLTDDAALFDFFNWSLRDYIPIRVFVEFPALRSQLVACNLSGRIGRMGGNAVLKLKKMAITRHLKEKVVTLPFDGIDVNILDSKRTVELDNGYRLSIAEAFEIFRDKHLRVGNLEFMQDGIINWNCQNWGRWNPATATYDIVDLRKSGWWKQLPFLETLALQEAIDRYGSKADGIHWIAAATATRGRASLDVDLTHAYLEVAVPMDAAHYAIFDFGKQAIEFPANFIDTLTMVCKTVHATIAYPDENVYYTHRQHALHAFALTPSQGFNLMDSIKGNMLSSRSLNLVYQIESENCAKWVQEKLEFSLGLHAIPNLFVMSIFQTEPLSFLRMIINFCKTLPESWQIKVLTFFHLPLGAAKGHWVLEHGRLVWRALTHHTFWNTGIIYLPCFLHRQKEQGFLDVRNIFFEHPKEDRPFHSEFRSGVIKDPYVDVPDEQSITKIISRLVSAFCVFVDKRAILAYCVVEPSFQPLFVGWLARNLLRLRHS